MTENWIQDNGDWIERWVHMPDNSRKDSIFWYVNFYERWANMMGKKQNFFSAGDAKR